MPDGLARCHGRGRDARSRRARSTAGTVPASVAALTEGVLRMMSRARLIRAVGGHTCHRRDVRLGWAWSSVRRRDRRRGRHQAIKTGETKAAGVEQRRSLAKGERTRRGDRRPCVRYLAYQAKTMDSRHDCHRSRRRRSGGQSTRDSHWVQDRFPRMAGTSSIRVLVPIPMMIRLASGFMT